MKFYLAVIFSLQLLNLNAQVEDHFDDGDFYNSPAWTGDGAVFNVNMNRQLQLNAFSAGNSFLSVPANLTSLDSCEWRLVIHMNFSPSTSNYARFYLVSDQADLKQPLNGYFLQFGEALSNDAIELFRQNGNTVTSVCRGQAGLIANSFSAGIKVFRNQAGLWTLSVDYQGGINYQEEASGIDTVFHSATYLGVNCLYTSGNITKFYFDDFYAGPIIPDTIYPFVTNLKTESDSVLSITFSESIENNSLYDFSNYTVDGGIGNPVQIIQDSIDSLKYYLIFPIHFLSRNSYSISISGLKDLSLNSMNSLNYSFIYYLLSSGRMNDIVFSEIYFEPSSISPLPNSEYVEIYNRNDSAIDVSGWVISDGSSDGIVSDFILAPNDFAVLYNNDDSLLFSGIYNAIPVSDFPTLNNDVGDRIRLSNANGEVIDELIFSDSYYHDSNKNDGGWSLERIDADFICQNENNWKASISNKHGSPGTVNSIKDEFRDKDAPYILSAFLSDSSSLRIIFSEPVSSEAGDTGNYTVTDENGNGIIPVSINVNPGNDTVVLHFTGSFQSGTYSLRVSNTITDCPGNNFEQLQVIRFGFPDSVVQNDIIINEILFNPFDGGSDFLELYNRSQKIIDIKGWTITEAGFKDSTDIKESSLISAEHQLIFPGQYLVLTENKENIMKFYYCIDTYAFLNIPSMPDFNSDEGSVIINDANGNTVDAYDYNEEMHFPLIVETKGVSLERLSEGETNDNINWHSAAATAGFATPGYRNSQWIGLVSVEDGVSVGEEIFSPDDDGYHDVLTIHYSFAQTGTVLSLNVFDSQGRPVRTILSGKTVGTEGVLIWDGLLDDYAIAPTGIYILLAKSFDLKGNDKTVKKAVFLTRKI